MDGEIYHKVENPGEPRVLKLIVAFVALFTGVGLLASQASGLIAAIGIGLEILIASGAVGVVLGFLFAVPRILSRTADPGDAKHEGAKASFLQSNTNLESISDWLSTMLVGVGISQLYQVNDMLLGFRNYIASTAKVFDGSAGTLPAVAPLLLIIGAVSGFIAMYLYTRINLARLFSETEGYLRGELRRAVVGAARGVDSNENSFVSAVANAENVTADDALNLMFDLLYTRDGYRSVINLGAQLQSTPIARTANYWFYLAAAYGQQMARAQQDKDEQLANQARSNAIDAARRAVAIDGRYRSRLWSISDQASTDNDLAPLRGDPEFVALVRGDRN